VVPLLIIVPVHYLSFTGRTQMQSSPIGPISSLHGPFFKPRLMVTWGPGFDSPWQWIFQDLTTFMLSVVGDIPIDSETLVVTSSISSWGFAGSVFEGAYGGRVCAQAFMGECVCCERVVLCNLHKKASLFYHLELLSLFDFSSQTLKSDILPLNSRNHTN
jgi:hypothetical protein